LECDFGKVGVTPPQFYVLATIGYAGSLPFGEIGAKMMVTVSNLTGIVDRLKQKNGFTEARRNRPPGCSPNSDEQRGQSIQNHIPL
jgi:DNA-binding MarR family transcriptional regulator